MITVLGKGASELFSVYYNGHYQESCRGSSRSVVHGSQRALMAEGWVILGYWRVRVLDYWKVLQKWVENLPEEPRPPLYSTLYCKSILDVTDYRWLDKRNGIFNEVFCFPPRGKTFATR